VIVGPGEICVWHSGRPVSFEMPEKFDKLCMIVPIARFESVLHNAETYEGLRLPGGSNLATLLGSYLSTLTDSVMTRNDNTPFDTAQLLTGAKKPNGRTQESFMDPTTEVKAELCFQARSLAAAARAGCQKISSSLRRERGIFFLTSPFIEHFHGLYDEKRYSKKL
jgi:hypothetical protein